MSYGLRVWDSSGKLVLDTSTRTWKLFSTHSGSIAAGATVNISVPGYVIGSNWAFSNAQTLASPLSFSHAANTVTVINRSLNSLVYKINVFKV